MQGDNKSQTNFENRENELLNLIFVHRQISCQQS